VGARLYGGFGVLVALMAISGAVSISNMVVLADVSERLYHEPVTLNTAAVEGKRAGAKARELVMAAALAGRDQDLGAILSELRETVAVLGNSAEQVAKNLAGANSGPLVERIEADVATLSEAVVELDGLVQTDRRADIMGLLSGDAGKRFASLSGALDEVITRSREQAALLLQSANSRRNWTIAVAVLSFAVAAILVVFIVVALTGSIVTPLRQITSLLEELAGGVYSFNQLEVDGNDEIAALRNAYNDFLQGLRSLVTRGEKLAAGDVAGVGSIDVHGIASTGRLAEVFDIMEDVQGRLGAQAEAVARDDLDDPVLKTAVAGKLGENFAAMTEHLRHLVNQAQALAADDLDNAVLGSGASVDGNGLGAAFSRMVVNQRLLAKKAQAIASGNLVDSVLQEGSSSGALSGAFSSMTETISGLVKGLGASAETLEEVAGQLLVYGEKTHAGAAAAAHRITDATTAVMEMSASIQEVAQNAKNAESMSQNGIGTAKRGGESIDQTIFGMRSVSDNMGATAVTIRELGRSGQEIGRIVAAIADIADQTNMLALNAAIEAARAGEQGRGFAVVADQVGKLAERSAKSANEISVLLEGIQTATAQSVEKMERSLEVVAEATDVSDESSKAMHEIIEVVEQMARSSKEISLATGQQADTADGVSETIESMLSTATESKEASAMTLERARELTQVANDMVGLSAMFRG